MTPIKKNKPKNNAESRTMTLAVRAVPTADDAETSYIVEGYATRWEPYVLYTDYKGRDIYEKFSKENFAETDMTDVIMQYDHQGKVYARTSNNTLSVMPDDEGLRVVADLSRTEGARQLYEDVAQGMVTKMSWRFSFADDEFKYDEDARTITYGKIAKVWDVSAVSIPANQDTSIGCRARELADGEISELDARIDALVKIEQRKKNLIERIKLNVD